MGGGYFRDMSNTTLIILIVVAIVVIVAIAIVGYQMARRKRTERLQEQYGPEYNRALDQADSQREAESELRDRSKRHEKLELRSLDSSEREDFERRWSDVQGQFVDDPKNAVHNADVLVLEVMSARGYPVEDFDQRADDLSVSHPEITQRYREASRIAQANEDGAVDTEDLRQAVTSYRALVLALLADDGDRTRQDDVDRGQQDDRDRSRQDDVDRTRHDDVDRTRQNDTQSEHDNNQMTERETKA
jgi:type II secretory pathway pseudopilin PulG